MGKSSERPVEAVKSRPRSLTTGGKAGMPRKAAGTRKKAVRVEPPSARGLIPAILSEMKAWERHSESGFVARVVEAMDSDVSSETALDRVSYVIGRVKFVNDITPSFNSSKFFFLAAVLLSELSSEADNGPSPVLSGADAEAGLVAAWERYKSTHRI